MPVKNTDTYSSSLLIYNVRGRLIVGNNRNYLENTNPVTPGYVPLQISSQRFGSGTVVMTDILIIEVVSPTALPYVGGLPLGPTATSRC